MSKTLDRPLFNPPRSGHFWKFDRSDQSRRRRLHDIRFTLLGAVMALIVFGIDTFTPIESAIAVLYVVALLVSSDALSRAGILAAASICFSLCLLSYALTHGLNGDLSTMLRLLVSLSAITITAALLLKNDTARRELIESHAETARGEYRYRSIFEDSRVAIWEQDYSRLRAYLRSLAQDGVVDIEHHAATTEGFVATCAGMVETVAVNDAAVELLHAASASELLGPLSKFIPDGDIRFLDVVHTLFNGGRYVKAQGSIQAVDGSSKSVLTVLKFPDDEAALRRVVVGLVDITEREQTHAALLAAQMELARAARISTVGVVSASIAHELHQPLAALTVNAETCLRWLETDPPDLAAARRAVERMVSDAERASGIVKSTRTLLAKRPASAETVDAVALIHQTAGLLEHELRRNRATLRIESAGNAVHVGIARHELQQVVINLVTNAMQAINDAGSPNRVITILISRSDAGKAWIEVSDTGPGIDESHLNKLFDAFFTTKADGMGMGLAISRSALEARGGRLIATNNQATSGASFLIELPLAGGAERASTKAAEQFEL